MYKKLLIFFGVAAVLTFFTAGAVYAADSTLYQTTAAPTTDNGNRYIANDDVTVTDDTSGDLVVAGGNVVVKGNVAGNIIAAGGTVQIDGTVANDVLAVGGIVIVNGNVMGDVRSFAGQTYINSKMIGGDLAVAAGEIGVAKGNTVKGMEWLKSKNVTKDSSTNPNDTTPFRVAYVAPRKNQVNVNTDQEKVVAIVLLVIGSLVGLVSSVISGYFVLRVFPVFTEKTVHTMQAKPLKSAVVGFGVVVGSLIFGLALLLSVVGWNLFFLLAVLGVVGSVFSGIFGYYTIGRWMLAQCGIKHPGRLRALVAGTVLLTVGYWGLRFIPVVGGLLAFFVGFGIMSWALGAIVTNKWNALMNKK